MPDLQEKERPHEESNEAFDHDQQDLSRIKLHRSYVVRFENQIRNAEKGVHRNLPFRRKTGLKMIDQMLTINGINRNITYELEI